tara:strand:+ start:1896 stop:2276 length:381 start_codon:yes stop_codon:yes gene_type:complete
MEVPTIEIPAVKTIETISIPLPTADVPSYVPMVIPPSDLEAEEEIQAETTETTEQPPPPKLNIPVINFEVPLPTADTVVVAGYAAVSAVAVTTFAQPFFDFIKKKIQKLLQSKIDKWKNQRKKKDL